MTGSSQKQHSLRKFHDYGKIPETATREYILDLVKKQNVQFLNMQFTDLFGIVKAITIPVSKLEDAIDHNVWFDGSSIEGFTRIFESDMFLRPDLRTFAVLPWTADSQAPTARIICDVYMSNGQPFSGDPRFILQRQLEKAAKLGYIYNTGPELEFFLFRKDENGKIQPLPHDNGGYFDQTTDLAAEIRQEMSFELQGMGIDVEALHHEVAAGSHEIDFRYADALTTADNAVTLRMVLKTVAMRHGLHATFMAKPIRGINGSGMHVHQSLFKNGANSFHEKSQESYGLSPLAKSFIAGQLEHIRECNLVTNPTVNSYKRLVVGYEAPVYIAWARTNRSALIRVPQITAGRESATRIELRCPDPTCNPYLAFAVMLAAGLDGVERGLTPPAPVEENIFHFDDEEVQARSIGTVCGNLKEAIDECKKSELMRSVLGEHTFMKLIEAKEAEWDDYRMSVTPWEIEKYLEVY
ncbi:type I glutamate--ammonia ligase [Candidatus Peregrinibacteria bacterium]|nr:type I glutamate--ammonia ligase [Candidatus Peregrinibacteria bacterium]